jgi:hypothetical protein
MEIVAAVFADFVDTYLGIPSQLRARLGSRAVLEHTLIRLTRIVGAQRRCLVVRPRDEAAARDAVAGLGLQSSVDVLPIDDGRRLLRGLLRCGRVWNLDAWRGGPMTTWFDEYVELPTVGRVLDHYRSDAALCLEGHQAALDPAIASEMIACLRENEEKTGYVFTQAPPGLGGIILGREVTRNYIKDHYPVGLLMTYRPELAQLDPITREPCYRIPSEICQTPARFAADTRAARDLLAAAFGQLGEDCDARQLCAWARAHVCGDPGRLPVEVELEITTRDPLPETTLRPRGNRVPQRELTDLDAVDRLVARLAAYDDRRLVLGGFGDPLLHPRFPEICRRIRAAPIRALAVVTPLVELADPNLDALLEYGIDLLEVPLDAHTAATYQAVQRTDAFAQVIRNIERLQNARRERGKPQPLVVCSLTRCDATFADLEDFFEHWSKTTGWAAIRGYNDYCGLLPPDTVQPMRPLIRTPCRRLNRRTMLLADGRAVLCSQDAAGASAVGSWFELELGALWTGPALEAARAAQRRMDFAGYDPCSRCGEWHRP